MSPEFCHLIGLLPDGGLTDSMQSQLLRCDPNAYQKPWVERGIKWKCESTALTTSDFTVNKKFVIYELLEVGYGVITLTGIEAGENVCGYGRHSTSQDAFIAEFINHAPSSSNVSSSNDHCRYIVNKKNRLSVAYANLKLAVDEHRLSVAYANLKLAVDEQGRLFLQATRKIEKYEALLCDYGMKHFIERGISPRLFYRTGCLFPYDFYRAEGIYLRLIVGERYVDLTFQGEDFVRFLLDNQFDGVQFRDSESITVLLKTINGALIVVVKNDNYILPIKPLMSALIKIRNDEFHPYVITLNAREIKQNEIEEIVTLKKLDEMPRCVRRLRQYSGFNFSAFRDWMGHVHGFINVKSIDSKNKGRLKALFRQLRINEATFFHERVNYYVIPCVELISLFSTEIFPDDYPRLFNQAGGNDLVKARALLREYIEQMEMKQQFESHQRCGFFQDFSIDLDCSEGCREIMKSIGALSKICDRRDITDVRQLLGAVMESIDITDITNYVIVKQLSFILQHAEAFQPKPKTASAKALPCLEPLTPSVMNR